MHYLKDFTLFQPVETLGCYALLRLCPIDNEPLPEIQGGQFVNIRVCRSHNTFLRRPISINYIDRKSNTLWLLVRNAGPATNALFNAQKGEQFSLLLPLGNGFPLPNNKDAKILLCGAGVGTAPMLMWGSQLKSLGYKPEFLLSGRSSDNLVQLEMFKELGEVNICTDDGSSGMRGFPTQHPVLTESKHDIVYCCGPLPMMKGIAKIAEKLNIECFVSLENKMACGLGACLCCVEETTEGHNECVCKKGPVFNTKELKNF